MNQKQKVVLIITTLIIISMGIFPPWQEVHDTHAYKATYDLGYWWITSPPGIDGRGQIDFGRLLLQCSLILILSSSVAYILKDNINSK